MRHRCGGLLLAVHPRGEPYSPAVLVTPPGAATGLAPLCRRTAPSALDTAPAAVVSFVRRRSAPALQVPTEVQRFFKKEHRTIVPLTVKDILDEEIAMKLA